MPVKKLFCFIFGFSVSFFHALSQAPSHSLSLPVFTSASFLYDFPQSFGAQVGMGFPLSSRHIFNNKTSRQKFRETLTETNIGFYRYVFNNTGLILEQSLGFRYHTTKPSYFEWLFTAGALRTFYDGLVYSVNNDGVVSTKSRYGRWYAITGITTGFGWDWQRSAKSKPFAVSMKPSLWVQYPYNSFILPHLSLQLLLEYHIPSFNVTVHHKEIKRGRHL